MSGGRPVGVTDSRPRERKQSAAGRQAQIQKSNATKKKRKAAKQAAVSDTAQVQKRASESNTAKTAFFTRHYTASSSEPTEDRAAANIVGNLAETQVDHYGDQRCRKGGAQPDDGSHASLDAEEDDNLPNTAVEGIDDEGNEPSFVTIDHPVVAGEAGGSVTIVADLDYDKGEAGNTQAKDADAYPGGNLAGVMQIFLKKVQKRIQHEVSRTDKENKNTWLLDHLRKNGW